MIRLYLSSKNYLYRGTEIAWAFATRLCSLVSQHHHSLRRQHDLRTKHRCNSGQPIVLVNLLNHLGRYAEAKCVAVNPRRPEQLAVGANDFYVRLYDTRMIKLSQIPTMVSNLLLLLLPHFMSSDTALCNQYRVLATYNSAGFSWVPPGVVAGHESNKKARLGI